MVRFAHMADVHLGGWRQGPMQDLNFKAFQFAVDKCIEKKVEFILIAGDLFDSAYPPIEILKETFGEFRKLKDAKIPVFLIAGSHDYSVSGKSFLDVLEKAGFCKNVYDFQIKEDKIILNPTIHNNIAIYGYPGKKSGLEVNDLRKIKLSEAPGMMKILMLHTTLDKVRGVLPIDCLNYEDLPEANYYAFGHIHVDFRYQNAVYPGPVFPNNFQELETLQEGSFYLIETDDLNPFTRIPIELKKIESIEIKVRDTKNATEEIIDELKKRALENKIVLLRISGELDSQKPTDIKFEKIEEYILNSGAYFFLKNTHDLKTIEANLDIEIKSKDNLEEETIKYYSEENPSKFNHFIVNLMEVLSFDKQEGETNDSFNYRILDETKKILELE